MSRSRACAVVTGVMVVMAASFAFAEAPKQKWVTVKVTQLRAAPSYLAKILQELHYGDAVQVVDDSQKSWTKVRLPEKKLEGWVNKSALSDKKIVLKAGGEKVEAGASSGEVALAGKGFNSEVEAEYKKDSRMDYTWVDRMGQFTVSPEQVGDFLAQGALARAEGGAK